MLRLMQEEPGTGLPDLAAALGLTPGRVARRQDRLREAGILQGVGAVIDLRALGFAVHVSLRITLDKTAPRAFDDFIAAAREVPEVIEIQTFLGRVDVRLSVVARNLPAYQTLYRNRLLALPHIADIESLMTVAVVKSDESLPL